MDSIGEKSAAYFCYLIINFLWYVAVLMLAFIPVGIISMLAGWISYPPEITFNIPISPSELEFSSDTISEFLILKNAEVDIASEYIFNQSPALFIGLQIFIVLFFLLVIYGFYQLRMILKSVVYEDIFTAKNIRRLKILAFAIMALDPLSWIYYYFFVEAIGGFVAEQSLRIEFGSFDLGYIVYGLLIYALATVFEKGYEMYQDLKLTV